MYIDPSGHSCDCLERHGAILKLLDDNRGRLIELIGAKAPSSEIPRYMLGRTVVTKTFNLAQSLKKRVIEFSQERNIQQKEIIEVALIEFLNKYGFREEVKSMLKI